MHPANDAPPIADDSISQKTSRKVPRWVPVSLLAVSTAALIAPVILLRRYRSSAVTRALRDAPPPRRTTTVASAGGLPVSSVSTVKPTTHSSATPASSSEPIDDFNGALYSAKAFGYATFYVVAGASLMVWGVKSYMGVQNTEEFAHRMRSFVLTRLPRLSERIHRASLREKHDSDTPTATESSNTMLSDGEDLNAAQWTWPDAEKRLSAAFEHGGFSGWAAAVWQEVEAEGEIERKKRGHT